LTLDACVLIVNSLPRKSPLKKVFVVFAALVIGLLVLSPVKQVAAISCSITSESITPISAALTTGSTVIVWTASASCPSPYIHNSANGLGYLCNGGSCVAAIATPVPNSYTYTFNFSLSQSSAAGTWTPRMTLRSSDGITNFDIGSNRSVAVSAYIATTTTTTTTSTTTTVPVVATTVVAAPTTMVTAVTSTTSATSTTIAANSCVPTKDRLYIYSFLGNVTNLGGAYDSGFSGFDYTRNCKVSPITKTIIKDNFSVVESSSKSFDKNFDKSVSNCWEIARVSSYGQSEWSNQVCYVAPTVLTSTTVAAKSCVPTTDRLYVYPSLGNVTNANTYDSGSSGFDYTRNCKVSPITKILIKDNFAVVELSSKSFNKNFDKSVSNCWEIARVSSYGQSEWSNQVCYVAPAATSPTTAKVVGGAIIQPQQPSSIVLFESVPFGVAGAQCLDGFKSKNKTLGSCGNHGGRDSWLFAKFAEGYNKNYQKRNTSNSSGGLISGSSSCVGICYGVPSVVNGLPRNSYVKGYTRSDGTYVKPYTRSKP